jgi:hypothetical protein
MALARRALNLPFRFRGAARPSRKLTYRSMPYASVFLLRRVFIALIVAGSVFHSDEASAGLDFTCFDCGTRSSVAIYLPKSWRHGQKSFSEETISQ